MNSDGEKTCIDYVFSINADVIKFYDPSVKKITFDLQDEKMIVDGLTIIEQGRGMMDKGKSMKKKSKRPRRR